MEQTHWSETVVLVDAEFLDSVVFDLIVNFERMINRRIPPADLCHWLDCIALDGGLHPGDNKVQAVFLYEKAKRCLENMKPSSFADELDGKAFQDNLGEFALLSFPVEDLVSADDFFVQSFEALLEAKDVKRLLAVGNMSAYGERLKKLCAEAAGEKDVTLFVMEPATGRGFSQEILGYSLMSALGIRSEELE